ncbi:MAG: glycoside hydrolase family protein [Chlorogloeopsis fritschii C42_A2020_084]|jgi:muramidase (phage lysozyme)|uniref:glycoside hydrolase family 24 protein n=1 Tax=Chlorogloeopsis fritschii TaxID=1124 RepID=UPI001A07C377|nr:glycoside hydrolase family protein [Chlorogloeopsis fritschii]MBF2007398.1 glycoside hydrolase family protein [Chlorogloeopsis fritschii C42_A2020_084]
MVKANLKNWTLKGFELKGAEKFIAPLAALLAFVYLFQWYIIDNMRSRPDPVFQVKQPPLVMKGGDPYIRALMRTISASEASSNRPYSILYGGQHVSDLSRHPEICVTIITGPNKGNCSTAAGRYQIINKTWYLVAPKYHPKPMRLMFWVSYSFEAEYQDAVVYRWLSDPEVWGIDISHLLKQGKLNEVLRRLSPTWTSLGYGIETNSVSPYLPQIYQKMLKEELKTNRKQQKGQLTTLPTLQKS